MTSPPGRALLRALLRSRRRTTAAASILFVAHQVGELMVPVVAGAVIDRAVLPGEPGTLLRWIALLALVFAGLSTSWRWADRILTRCVETTAHDLRRQLAERAVRDDGLADSPPVGQMVSIATSDVTAAVQFLAAVAHALAAVAAVATSAVVLLVISRPLGLVVVIGLPPVLWVLQALSGPIERRATAQQADIARAAATATDLLAGLRIVKGLHAEVEAARRYRRDSRRSLAAGLRAARLYAAHSGLTATVTGLFVALVALLGGRLAAEGRIGVGGLVAAIGVTQFLIGPLGRLSYAAGVRAAARASAERVAALLAAPPTVRDADGAPPARVGPLRMDGVRWGPLAGLDLSLSPGEFVAITASEPPALDAVATLLARRADPVDGAIELDGIALPAIALRSLRDTVVVADNHAVLFSGSMLDNLTASEALPREALDALLAAVAADDVVQALPHGLDTPVTERGVSLSGGQRQRVALARCLAGDPPILVLHEPTSAVDAVTEAQIARGLRALRGCRTTILLTTSPALLAAADRVLFIDGGRVVDAGSHDALVAQSARYRAVVTA